MFKDYLASSKQNIEQWLGEVLNARWQTNTTYFN